MKGSHIPYKPAPQFFKTLFSVDLYLFHVTVYIHNNLYIKQLKHFLIYMSFNYTSLIIWNSYNLSKWLVNVFLQYLHTILWKFC